MNESGTVSPSIPSVAIIWLRTGMEGIVLFMVALSPWFFGAVDPVFEYALFAGTAGIALLWGIRSLLEKQFLWFACPVALMIGAVFLWGAIQLIPLPRWVLYTLSPASASLQSDLRPEHHEVLEANDPPISQPGWLNLTYYPAKTRHLLTGVLALLVLFAAIRVNIASTAALKRLAWLCIANGVALSLFGLMQLASYRDTADSHQFVYSFQTKGSAFGPFICRNHFAFYINMCIGLSTGLLLACGRSENDKRARRVHKAQALVEQSAEDESTFSILSFLHSPVQLWLSIGIAVMGCGLIASMSRGGVAALVIGLLIAMGLRGPLTKRPTRIELFLIPILAIVGLIAWLGIKPLESRLNIFRSGVTDDGRLEMWKNLAPVALKHPIFGTGYGTLQYIEPIYRTHNYSGDIDYTIDHAHSDYLEALVEGGIPRLAATLAAVWLLMRFGRKALRRHETLTPARLGFGALAAVAAVAVHSAFDFGMFTPAVAVLATVTAAHLCGMARSNPSEPPSAQSKHYIVVRLGGWGGAAGAVALVSVALVLLTSGSTQAQIFDLRLRAFAKASPEIVDKALKQAIALAPDDAELRVELGQFYLNLWQNAVAQRDERLRTSLAAAMFAGGQPLACVAPMSFERSGSGSKREYEVFIKPALLQMVAARDICPLLPQPQARLAGWAKDAPTTGPKMVESDPAEKYWLRAVRLTPFDPDMLYRAGQFEFESGNYNAAWDLWQRSLARRTTYLHEIVRQAAPILHAGGVLDRLLPDDAAALIEADSILAAQPDPDGGQKRILEKAKSTLQEKAQEIDIRNAAFMLAVCHQRLGEVDAAKTSYERALLLEPRRWEWRFEYAKFLCSLPGAASKRQALRELTEVLRQNSSFTPAANLKLLIERELDQ